MANYTHIQAFPVSFLQSETAIAFRVSDKMELKAGDTVTFEPDGLKDFYKWQINSIIDKEPAFRRGHHLITCGITRITMHVHAKN